MYALGLAVLCAVIQFHIMIPTLNLSFLLSEPRFRSVVSSFLAQRNAFSLDSNSDSCLLENWMI